MLSRRILSIFLIFCFMSSTSYAQTVTSTTGVFSIVKQGDKVKFDGVLLDPTAVAIIIADKEQADKDFQLKSQYDLSKQKEDYEFKLKNIQLELDTTKETDKSIIEAKDKELTDVRKIALGKSDNTWFYIGGGALGGIILTLAVLFVSKKTN